MIIHKKLNPKARIGAAKHAKSGSIVRKRVVKSDGRRVTVVKIDADSETFTDDLTYVFEKNVAKARRQNNKLLG
jgi:ribosomal protein L4